MERKGSNHDGFDSTKRHALVGEWIWEYDGDEPYAARMYWAPNAKPPEPVRIHWCRWPWCEDNAVSGEFCSKHTVGGPV